MPSRIEITEIEVLMHVGCSEAERRNSQPVRVRLTVNNPDKFPAATTDQVVDTIDAELLRSILVEQTAAHSVKTLERLGQVLEDSLNERFPQRGLSWEIVLTKPRYGWSYGHTWVS